MANKLERNQPGATLIIGSGALGTDAADRARGARIADIEMAGGPDTGQIAYAVSSSGDFRGMRNRLFAISWNALTLETNSGCFILDISKEHLEDAPGFNKDNRPSMADQSRAVETHAYYGAQPYWADMHQPERNSTARFNRAVFFGGRDSCSRC